MAAPIPFLGVDHVNCHSPFTACPVMFRMLKWATMV